MNPFAFDPDRPLSRRKVLGVAAASGAGAVLFPHLAAAADTAQPYTQGVLSNGSADPFPIPWLDKNGNHNQPAGPHLEPSHVYHFKGRVGRCAGFTGMGTDNQGNRIAFGAKTTDFGFMDGEYFAARVPHRATLTHI